MASIKEVQQTSPSQFDFMAVEKLVQFIESFKSNKDAKEKMLNTLELHANDLRCFGPELATRLFWVYNNIRVLLRSLDSYETIYSKKVLTRQ